MAPSVSFTRAEAERTTISETLDFLEAELLRHQTTPLNIHEVTQFLSELEDAKKLIGPNHTTLTHNAPPSCDMEALRTGFRTLNVKAARIHAGFHGIKCSFPPPTTPSPTPTSSTQKIKLPPLEIPKFSGNLQEWVSFRDIFTTAVHNSSLSKVEKLTQLKSLLTGEAQRQVRSIMLSDTNYDIAWKALHERYENNRELLFSIMKRLLNQPVITSSSAVNIRSMIDTTKECVRSLEILSIPTQHWDAILLFIIFSKLDPTSRELWEQSLPDTKIPQLSALYDFLEQRARALAASTVSTSTKQQSKQQNGQVRAHHITTSTCKLSCSDAHPLFRCPEFRNKSPQQRFESVKGLKLCHNCLSEGHLAASCPSRVNCKQCNRRHHTMIHLDQTRNQQQDNRNPQGNSNTPTTAVQTHYTTPPGVLQTGILATARVRIETSWGDSMHRALIDPGSTNTYITEQAARRMSLQLKSCHVPMTGMSASSIGVAKFITTFTFKPYFKSAASFTASALVVKSVSNIPSEKLLRSKWSHLNGLQLADPDFHLPDKIDILLGTDVVWTILDNDRVPGKNGEPYAVKSSLGWLVAGPNIASSPATVFNVNTDIDTQVRRFWEQEEIGEDDTTMTTEEAACEKHFQETYTRDNNGRFVVTLPLKLNRQKLGSSREAAVRRFLSLEKKFNNPTNIQDTERLAKLTKQWTAYKEFMTEYEQLGHMSLIPINEIQSSRETYYIPHHSVLKESSTTTKLRVVFDASAQSSTKISLNDLMMVGPTLQDDIWKIMIRFRLRKIAFTADVAKMYRQILVTPRDTDLQRIVWRQHPSHPLRDYRLLTVTYGTSSAPYLAVKCLRQLAENEKERYPLASKVMLHNFYVDDTASGSDSISEAKETVDQLLQLCKLGGFELRKWTTNSSELLSHIPEPLREVTDLVQFEDDVTVKTLGLCWKPREDKYIFKITLPEETKKCTKRIILSEIARIYDPLGWLSPVIISLKIFMQEMWKLKFGWDDTLPSNIQDKWNELRCDLKNLERIEIPRCVIPHHPVRLILVGYADASTKAMSAVNFIRSEYDDGTHLQQMLSSKTKVAPIKHVSLPRLELNAAVLLSKLMKTTLMTIDKPIDEVRAYSDSMITIHWIRSSPLKWKTYVRRRVQTIQDNLPNAQWYHVRGNINPADCASRGISAAELHHHPLWWNGGNVEIDISLEQSLIEEDVQTLELETQATTHHVNVVSLPSLFLKFSSFKKLVHVIAYVLRFLNNWVRPLRQTPVQCGSLTVTEIRTAHNLIIKTLQQSCFSMEFQCLKKGNNLPTNHPFLKLQPFICSEGLLRVGGRLRNAMLSYNQKHPILLPRSHTLTSSIILDIHQSNLHSGPSATLATLQQRYWITRARDTVRAIIRRCVICTRHRPRLMNQIMGDLPKHRVNPSPPFSKCGVDYAGPFIIKPLVRSKVTLKCWIAIFVCLATRAIHIEVVSSLSSECFLAAFRRFIGRRGKPSDIYSDCGTNFKGADAALKEFFAISRQNEIQNKFVDQQIQWHFNPPGAPHFGGLWEAGVKSIKHHLVRVMGASRLTYEEMHTLTTQIEAILNSRPISGISTDPSDFGVLTPGHFLIGGPITAIPEPSLIDDNQSYLKRWQLLQQHQQKFWKRWSNEYLSRLQQRPKWMLPVAGLKPNDLVIIKDERLPPLHWKLGRVAAIHPGADGHVRVATIKTADGEFKRPITKLVLLPVAHD